MSTHYHDFSRFAFFGLRLTPWECSCGIKTWRHKNVELLQSTVTVSLEEHYKNNKTTRVARGLGWPETEESSS